VSWATDSRNRAIFPTKGNLQKVSGEVAVPGSDWQYYKVDYEIQQFFPLFLDLTGALNAELGYGDGYGDDDALPFFENYFAGGIRSVRGFQSNSLGPREDDDPIGGAFKTVGTAEILVPISLTDENLRNVRLSGFFDIGTVFPNVDDFDRDDLRYSVGVSVIWLSPFGPLTLSIAEPLNDEPEDETEAFQFTLGTPF
jgi:outer membrane protein insertion porin family